MDIYIPIQSREVAQIFHPAHLVIKQRRMRHVPDVATSLARILSEDGNRALCRLGEPGQCAQECGLPCSVVAEEGVTAPLIEFSRHAAQGGKSPELLDHVRDFDSARLPGFWCHLLDSESMHFAHYLQSSKDCSPKAARKNGLDNSD